MTAWFRIDMDPSPWPCSPRLLFTHLQLSSVILFTAPLSDFILTEKCLLLRVRSACPPLCRCPRYPFRGRFVTAPETAWKSHPLRIISSGRNCALNLCSVKMIKSRDGKMLRSWIDPHFSGVIPRMLKVRPWRGWVEGEERDDCFCFFLLLSALLNTRLGRLPSGDVGGEACWGGKGCI